MGYMTITVDKFISKCKDETVKWYKEHLNMDDIVITENDIALVWQAKVLQNHKCVLVCTKMKDHCFEFTYNGDAEEIYMNVYRKESNTRIYW